MKIYLHQEGQHEAEAVEVDAGTRLRELVTIDDGEELFVLVEDADDPLDIEITIEESGVKERAHVFAGRRHRIVVEVLYNGDRRERTFAASARVSRVFKWATGKQGFDLGKADAAEHALALLATNVVPSGDVHVGSLDDATPGQVVFALIPKHRYEG